MHKDLDIGIQGELYKVQITQHLARVWKTLRGFQKDSEKYRQGHVELLSEHYAECRETSKEIELKR